MKYASVFFLAFPVWMGLAQQDGGDNVRGGHVPIYRVMVERRSIHAINYGHRNGPTNIDFRGTVLLPKAKGGAKVESHTGAVEVDAKFEKMEPPTRFGPGYLTYVLWAITPDGRPVNLGEILSNSSDKGKLRVTTQLQSFGLIVTAEPYFAVTRPSNVVVLENVRRPDTVGTDQEVEARYELLPRREEELAAQPVEVRPSSKGGKALPMDQYEAVVALYQAQNAVQIARAQGADRYAADTLRKAEQYYREAYDLRSAKADSKRVITIAREAAQTAEDARTIAASHAQVR